MTGPGAPTVGQTIGPFFGFSLPYAGGPDLVPATHPDAVRLHGRVLDGDGVPVPDALVEIWQAGPDGAAPTEPGSLRRDGWTFTGWGRAGTNGAGEYSFSTLLPGAVNGVRFAAVAFFARGLLDRLLTRVYFPADGADGADGALSGDPLLASLPAERRPTLIAEQDGPRSYRFDIVLQGERETVFLSHGAAR
jgi:protocatechuate 3,4-dioxygenase, alpha subunit